MKNEISAEEIKSHILSQFPEVRKYRLKFEVSQEIVYVNCLGANVTGRYEIDVDMGGKSMEKVINELTAKLFKLIRKCKEESP